MLLADLQRELEGIYEIHVPLAVQDFLITDRDAISRLAVAPPGDTREALYLVEDEEGAALSLFIDESVLNHLAEDDPRDALHEGNLADFCIALEGVSHFTYLAWRASHDHSVSELELEVQAEVDKFVTSAMLFGRQSSGQIPKDLNERLFRGASYLPGLARDRRVRYERANDYAGRFCEGLERRYMRGREGSAMTRELRRFYRLNQRQKLRHIANA
ncbi:MAG: hypothetical protein ACI9DC_000308 [Gammaproteobacteria bacterium]|jgi:hypothetical protein